MGCFYKKRLWYLLTSSSISSGSSVMFRIQVRTGVVAKGMWGFGSTNKKRTISLIMQEKANESDCMFSLSLSLSHTHTHTHTHTHFLTPISTFHSFLHPSVSLSLSLSLSTSYNCWDVVNVQQPCKHVIRFLSLVGSRKVQDDNAHWTTCFFL